MSPVCKMMLFTGSPLSINWFKFTVMVLDKGGGMVGIGASFAAISAEGKLVSGAGVTGAILVIACEGSTAEAPEAGTLFFGDGGITSCAGGGITSSLLIAGLLIAGVGKVSGGSEIGRVTITVSPASGATPPASANTSSKVIGRSA